MEFWAVHDRYFDFDSLVYGQGDSIIYLWVTPKRTGAAIVKVSITDNGETIFGDNYFEDSFFIKVLDFGVPTENSPDPGNTLYPNPADHHLYITGMDHYKRYTVFSLSGIRMADQLIMEEVLRLDTNDYPPGIYYIMLSGIDRLKEYKFIVLH